MPQDLASMRRAVNRTGVDDAVAGVDAMLHCASKGHAEASQELLKAAMAHRMAPHLLIHLHRRVNGRAERSSAADVISPSGWSATPLTTRESKSRDPSSIALWRPNR